MSFVFRFGGSGPWPFGPGPVPGQDGAPIFGDRPPRPPRRPIGGPVTRTVINALVTLVFGLIWYYLELPALNAHAEDLYLFLFLLCAVWCLSALFTSGSQGEGIGGYVRFVVRQCKIPFFLILGLLAVVAVGSLSSWPVLRAKSYSALLPLSTGDFAAEVEEIRYDQIPMLDGASAARLADRRLGELADMVSQFEILPVYDADGSRTTTQINYHGRPVRVTSLAYGDLIKWFNNRSRGLPAYLIIDMVTREAEVVRLEEGMRYSVAEHLGRNLYRHLRFRYPTMMFDDPVFEIDEEGVPWWVCPRIVKRVGLFGGTDIQGCVLVQAVTGESAYYAEPPAWVDRLFSADVIVRQYDWYGRYHNGFLNSILGQRDVTVTTEGWNYIAQGDDVYMYTGITSVVADESNIGFILSNQRTKETKFYSIAGAEEYSAMDSAQSQVQQMRYTATFPLLLNIAGEPTYFMALKGADGLVKMYAMVDVQQYDIVSTGATVAECEANYARSLSERGIIPEDAGSGDEIRPDDAAAGEGTIREIRTAVIGGDTHLYARMDDGSWLDFDLSASPEWILLDVGDRIVYGAWSSDDGSTEGPLLPVAWARDADAPAVPDPAASDPTSPTGDAPEAPETAASDPTVPAAQDPTASGPTVPDGDAPDGGGAS